ncbi:OBERON-like protein [Nicotiana tabacum]|uniref:OBERON-like protein n=1 Tax=Nicotiana tabacum TaxID=4097 RepID=A0A1S4B2C4_TOBAC|nr:OBERON-like protein [Nicotiana tomentosiformis]XP_009609186.1 OBERON-like protein [Nicotiana tomentosiformis]XP_016482998.1 PREDICTED: OBERON-like protein [Nicotiana tabacum]XP_016482999.1 PREDICTED: OBERON-like protein [Nicotiana tabacum]
MLPPRQQPRPGGLQTSLSLVSPDACGSPNPQERGSTSDQARDSPSESASSRETWPTSDALMAKKLEKEKENGYAEHSVVRNISNSDKMSLRDIARERVDVIAERMRNLPDEYLEKFKHELRVILEGLGGSQHREEFLFLQRLVNSRGDLTDGTLIITHRTQLEILVAIKTGIQAFLHPSVSLSQASLIDIFLYKRCRNIACGSVLPAEECSCKICAKKNGFCNLCMCVICNKFDFEVNTCRWIGCDLCSHWTHTDCAISNGQIGTGPSVKNGASSAETLFRCHACSRTSELLGWVKDVFQHCAPSWDAEAFVRELDYVRRIFQRSEDARGRKLFWKCEELIEKLKGGVADPMACKVILSFFQELDVDPSKSQDNDEGGRLIAPQEAFNKIADVVQEAIRKMEAVAEEKMRMVKKARLALDACDQELKDKAREVTALKMERQRKKQQIDELESIVRLKQAEADMFDLKAGEARREAERLQRIALAKTEKSEEDYASRYLKQRLSEAEAEKQYLFEKIKLQESSRTSQSSAGGSDPSQMMYSKIQDLIKNM